MSYPLMKRGDRLPAVGVLQKLLNARVTHDLVEDGIYGPRTEEAVRSFQRQRQLGVDGIVGQNTWPRLKANEPSLKVLDCIDVFDESLLDLEASDVRNAGGSPVLIGGMSNGLEQAIREIRQAAGGGGVFLLRFHGHGRSGSAGVAMGTGRLGPQRNRFSVAAASHGREIIARLKSIFGPYGCIQFMHCSTARGREGQELLRRVADAVRVPVTAALNGQYGGGTTTFRLEGATRTAVPGHDSIKLWCRSLQIFAARSVA